MKMFPVVLFLFGFMMVASFSPVLANDNPWEVKLPFETGIIHYKISGSQKGEETLYIRDHGNERVKVTKSEGKVMFVSTATDTIEITTRDSVINIDREKKTGTKMTNPQKIMQEEIAKLSASERQIVMKNLEAIGSNMATQMGGEVKPKAGKHLGYTCDLVTIMGSTSCQMSGTPIMLTMKSDIMGVKMKTVAKSIDKNAALPKGIFEVPKGIKVTFDKQVDDMNRQMVVSMIQSMKDPDAAKKYNEQMKEGKQQMEEARRQEAMERQQQAEQQAEQGDNTKDESSETKDQDMDEMMEKGMDAIKGLFK